MAEVLLCVLDYHPESTGGAERQARLQAEELTRRGHRVTVVCRRLDDARSGPVGPVQVDRLASRRQGWGRGRYYLGLAWYLARRMRRFDVVHVHHANAQAEVVVALGRLLRRPVYLKLAAGGPSGEMARLRSIRRWTGHAALRGADAVQALSPEITAELLAVGVRPERIVEIPNGVDVEAFRPPSADQRRAARQALGMTDAAVVVLSLGRFSVEKGTSDLLRAWEPLRGDPGLALVLVGRPASERPTTPVGRDNVHVHGWRDDPVGALWAADVFVLPSHGEGMSNALLEAMATGLPSIVTPVGSGAALVGGHAAGAVVPIGDTDALTAAIRRLASDPLERRRAGLAARGAVEDLTVTRVVDRLEGVYGRISGHPFAAPDPAHALGYRHDP